MNGKPHVHEVQVSTNYGGYVRRTKVTYGDTRINFRAPINPAQRALKTKRMIEKAIRRHDEGSKREAAKRAAVDAAVGEANAKLQTARQAENDLQYKYRYMHSLTEKERAAKKAAEANIKWASELIK